MDSYSQSLSEAGNPPSRALLRRLIRELLRTDADLTGFCLDHFPEVHERFSTGMDRLSKVNLLLELSEPGVVAMRLRERWGIDQARDSVFESTIHGWARPDLEKAHALREELEGLYRDREAHRLKGLDTSAIDKQIIEIKRIQRQVPKLQEGEVLADRYRLLEIVGRGGFANVWQAMDRAARRLVAVKVLHIEQGEESRRIERFIRGARQMQNLDHPHIVRVIDGPEEYHGFHFFVMDYITGGDLSRAVASRAVDRETGLRAIVQVGSALQFAHQRGLIHRDIKPQNILIDEQQRARLTDFDLVWAPDSTGGTRTGAMGTFLYAPPEEMEDASRVDQRVDIYSLGMSAIFVLYGKNLPRQVLDARDSFIDRLDCPEAAKTLLRQATALDPAQRPNSATDFCNELQRIWPFLRDPLFVPPETRSSVLMSSSVTSASITKSAVDVDPSIIEEIPRETTGKLRDSKAHFAFFYKFIPKDLKSRKLIIPACIILVILISSSLYWSLIRSHSGESALNELMSRRVVQVITDPAGAAVQVDGKAINEITPTGITGSIGTTARIRLLLAGYVPYEATVLFTQDPRPPLRVRLNRTEQRPSSADLSVYDERPNIAPAETDKKEEVLGQQKPIDNPVLKKFETRPRFATLTVLVRPWAIVYIDGKKIQQTPLRNYPISFGNHKILLKNENKAKNEEIKLRISAGETIPEIKRNWD